MSKRKRSSADETDSDWGSDEFEVDPGFDDSLPETGKSSPLPAITLTADQVAAVRFHTTRPGYSFEQVEIFVDQVKGTLAALEQALYEKDVALYESKEEQGDLQDRISTLAATIEVFRAKGDPVVKSDGSYLTESQQGAFSAEIDHLKKQLEDSTHSLSQARAEVLSFQTEVARLSGLLASAEQQRAEAEAAEDELRRYIDETLGPWIARQSQNAESQEINNTSSSAPRVDGQTEEPAQPLPPATPEASIAGVQATTPPNVPLAPTPTSPEPSLGGDDWGDDAPSIGTGNLSSDEPTAPAVIPEPPVEDVVQKPTRKKAKLIDAPELQG